jgi:hypothetical protein
MPMSRGGSTNASISRSLQARRRSGSGQHPQKPFRVARRTKQVGRLRKAARFRCGNQCHFLGTAAGDDDHLVVLRRAITESCKVRSGLRASRLNRHRWYRNSVQSTPRSQGHPTTPSAAQGGDRFGTAPQLRHDRSRESPLDPSVDPPTCAGARNLTTKPSSLPIIADRALSYDAMGLRCRCPESDASEAITIATARRSQVSCSASSGMHLRRLATTQYQPSSRVEKRNHQNERVNNRMPAAGIRSHTEPSPHEK